MNNDRRRFLRHTGALTAAGLVGNLGTWAVESAQAASTDFRAAVCVFLFGGNDSNNMVIPNDARYADYATVRTPASNVGIAQAMLSGTAITDKATGDKYGLHPNLVNLSQIYNSNRMAVLANVGTLLQPMTVAQYKAGTGRPPNLYSHSDQQVAWMGQLPNVVVRTGWGGRAADKLKSYTSGAEVSPTISVSGNQIFTVGGSTMPFVIPGNGGVNLSGQGSDAVSVARYNALRSLLASASGNQVVDGAAAVLGGALDMSEAANPVLTATLPPVISAAFVDPADSTKQLNTSLAQQLKQVARLIEARSTLGLTRQFFFVSIGGFDNHSALLTNQNNLYKQVDDAVGAFYDYTVNAGVASQVTTFTASDFNRTFIGNANAGTDHAYGSHHFVLGGAVNGGRFYGTFPSLVVKGADDAGTNGAWLPTTAVDQVGATIASWLGVTSTDLNYVFPNLANFSTKNLGFV
ncbi:MAG: DUF1501 domain-containing protein [Proteobacteria bacterium]|nr:DUF1501 domain-containing protein [Pseudomonadota bacterium]